MAEAQRASQRRRRLFVGGLSLGVHLVFLAALLSVRAREPPEAAEFTPMPVELVQLPPPPPPEPEKPPTLEPPKPAPPKAAKPAPAKAARKKLARPAKAPVPPQVLPIPAGESVIAQGEDEGEVSESELAGATTAGSGGGGRSCDMVRRLQTALRKDRRVQAAVAEAHRGKALRVWNGDWVRHAGQDGAGLAAVREAIIWEVGFAPEACRAEPVRGLILISLNDGPGAARLVVGSGRWRWSDLLFLHGGVGRR